MKKTAARIEFLKFKYLEISFSCGIRYCLLVETKYFNFLECKKVPRNSILVASNNEFYNNSRQCAGVLVAVYTG